MTDNSLYVMSPLEIAWGYVPGHIGSQPATSSAPANPRVALERAVRRALERTPCGVAFSGGRDSSAVLAVATHVARRDGLPEPIPVTKIFPGVPEAGESEWQETVVRHLRLNDWERIFIDDELDLVGPLAQENLLEHGILWPPTIHGDLPVVESVAGGSLLDGEGGDEVLGVGAHRIAPLANLIRKPRPLRLSRFRSVLDVVAPVQIRLRRLRQRLSLDQFSWLQPAALDALTEALSEIESVQPLSFANSVQMIPRRRSQVLLARNRRLLAAPYDVDLSSPLLDDEFVRALAHDGGTLGRGDRATVLRTIAGDLLPDPVLVRPTKAVFGGAFWARHTRAFVQTWTGEGLDAELVDPDELKRLWRSASHNALTSALLQKAWILTGRRIQ